MFQNIIVVFGCTGFEGQPLFIQIINEDVLNLAQRNVIYCGFVGANVTAP